MVIEVKDSFLNMEKFDSVTNPVRVTKAKILLTKANALRMGRLFKESVGFYLKTIFLNRNNSDAYFGLSLSYKNIGKYEKAIDCLNKARKLTPFNSEIYYQLGICYNIIARPDLAVKNLKKAIKLNKSNLSYQIQLGISHELMDEYTMAFAIYEKIIEEEPSFLLAYNYKATLFLNMGNYESASLCFYQILKLISFS